jgi:hypothetical protein
VGSRKRHASEDGGSSLASMASFSWTRPKPVGVSGPRVDVRRTLCKSRARPGFRQARFCLSTRRHFHRHELLDVSRSWEQSCADCFFVKTFDTHDLVARLPSAFENDRVFWNPQLLGEKLAERGVSLSFNRPRFQLNFDCVAMLADHSGFLRVWNNVEAQSCHWYWKAGHPEVDAATEGLSVSPGAHCAWTAPIIETAGQRKRYGEFLHNPTASRTRTITLSATSFARAAPRSKTPST